MQEINTWPGWESVRQIGSGSFGKVYEIQREEFGKTYKAALKVITIPQNESELENAYDEGMDEKSVTDYFRGFVESITDEFALMSQMKGYTNIVSYEDHIVIPHEGRVGWDILIRMELLTPIQKWCKDNPLSESDVIKLGCDICRALEICQRKNIIHRDIKPENIFVNEFGDYKLGDFGIARTVEKTMSNLSKKGTYSYMAPEVYLGKNYGTTADIYSLGTVLYRFLNENRTPFLPLGVIKFTDKEEALTKRMSGLPVPSPAHGSEKLKAVVLKSIAFDPKERYRSATEFLHALEDCVVKEETVKEKTDVLSMSDMKQDSFVAEEEKETTVYGVEPVSQSLPRPENGVEEDEEGTMILAGGNKPKPQVSKHVAPAYVPLTPVVNVAPQPKPEPVVEPKVQPKVSQPLPQQAALPEETSTLLLSSSGGPRRQESKPVVTPVVQNKNIGVKPKDADKEKDVKADQEFEEYLYEKRVAQAKKKKRITSICIAVAVILIIGSVILLASRPSKQKAVETASTKETTEEKKTTEKKETAKGSGDKNKRGSALKGELQVYYPTDVMVIGDQFECAVFVGNNYVINSVKYVSWSSSDKSVVKVEDGVVLAVSPGEAKVTCTYDDRKYSFDIIVAAVDTPSTVKITADCDQVSLSRGESKTITLNVEGGYPGESGVYAYSLSERYTTFEWAEWNGDYVSLKLQAHPDMNDDTDLIVLYYYKDGDVLRVAGKTVIISR